MTLQNHLFTNTIPLPPHHHILILNSQKMCRKIGHILLKIYRVPILRSLQNIIPPIRQVEKNVSQNRTHFPQNLSHAATFFHTQQEVWIMLSKVIRAPVYFL